MRELGPCYVCASTKHTHAEDGYSAYAVALGGSQCCSLPSALLITLRLQGVSPPSWWLALAAMLVPPCSRDAVVATTGGFSYARSCVTMALPYKLFSRHTLSRALIHTRFRVDIASRSSIRDTIHCRHHFYNVASLLSFVFCV